VLHGAAVLLRIGAHWDWLITLSAEDYPLVTQDGKKNSPLLPSWILLLKHGNAFFSIIY